MKIYLEIKQTLTPEESMEGIQPQEIRILVVDKAEAVEKLPDYEPLFSEMDYTKKVHYCPHPEGSCWTEDL